MLPFLSMCFDPQPQLPAACPGVQGFSFPWTPPVPTDLSSLFFSATAALSAESTVAMQTVPTEAALRVPVRACRGCPACRWEAWSSSWSWQRQGPGCTLRVHGHLALWLSITVTTSSLRSANYTYIAPACIVFMVPVEQARRMLVSRIQHPCTVSLGAFWCRASPAGSCFIGQPA